MNEKVIEFSTILIQLFSLFSNSKKLENHRILIHQKIIPN